MARYATSFRLSDETRRLLAALADRLGISMADVIALAVRRLAREEGIE